MNQSCFPSSRVETLVVRSQATTTIVAYRRKIDSEYYSDFARRLERKYWSVLHLLWVVCALLLFWDGVRSWVGRLEIAFMDLKSPGNFLRFSGHSTEQASWLEVSCVFRKFVRNAPVWLKAIESIQTGTISEAKPASTNSRSVAWFHFVFHLVQFGSNTVSLSRNAFE